ncbi:MAG: ABC transporter ATP-binding protein [Spirochaetes bacterium]|nr:ABC transporter ATP-binding protein [Spirochaetota bacterium]
MINSETNSNVIDINHLTVGYGIREVLSDIQANVTRGQFVSILGPNGVGKTTFLRTLSRHLKKIRGNIELNEKNIDDFSQKELAKELAVVLTTGVNTELFTGFEFAAMGRYPHTDFIGRLNESDKQMVMDILNLVHAENLAHRPMNEMSDGERQKLFIARALCQEPEIILLDEPTAHLDLKHKMEIMHILRNSCREKNITIIASMHDIDLAARVSDQVALVKDGKIIAWGLPEEVLTGENVRELYEMDRIGYDRTLATIEIKYQADELYHTGKVFCIAGSGSASILFRSLVKAGYIVSTGVLHDNEIDYHVASSLDLKIACAPAYEKITFNMINECEDLIKEADFVIDSGFIARDLNIANIELINFAVNSGKKVYSLRNPDELKNFGLESGGIIPISCDYELLKAINGKNNKVICKV